MHLEARQGTLWGQMPLRGLWLWVALVGSRVAMMAVAYAIGAKAAYSFDAIILTLGINRLAGTLFSRAVAVDVQINQLWRFRGRKLAARSQSNLAEGSLLPARIRANCGASR